MIEELKRRYSEPQRHYHTLQHIEECLAHFDALRAQAADPHALVLAIWFHDAVYDVTAHDNEARSASLARAMLPHEPAIETVCSLIMATCHRAPPPAGDAAIMVDVDLAILAAPPVRFAEYEAQIRAEYRHVPQDVYERKRREVLRQFHDRPHIFSTPDFRASHEAAARVNLARAIGLAS